MTNIALVNLARGIAIGAHAGQFDKAGEPYISHPARVAAASADLECQVLAWLHDTVEDTAVTLALLTDAGFPRDIVLQVDALTHRKNEPRDEYYDRILVWPKARRVKLDDVLDNSREERLHYLPEETQARLRVKYRKAYQVLTYGGAA